MGNSANCRLTKDQFFYATQFSDRVDCSAYLKGSTLNYPVRFPVVRMNQTHSNRVAIIHKLGTAHLVNYSSSKASFIDLDCSRVEHDYYVDSDALITSLDQVCLVVKSADCLPIFIVGGDYISVIHAGRRGTLTGIVRNVCKILQFLDVVTISVWFGPASCVCCYEVDSDTGTHFDLINSNKEQIESVYSLQRITYANPNGHFMCTQCHSSDLYSYRSGDQDLRNLFGLAKQ